jgi:hypothetical protein
MTADNGSNNFFRKICCFVSFDCWVRVNNSLNKGEKLLPKVVASLFGHLSWQMVHTVVEDKMPRGFRDLIIELFLDSIVNKEGLLNGVESGCELYGPHVIC